MVLIQRKHQEWKEIDQPSEVIATSQPTKVSGGINSKANGDGSISDRSKFGDRPEAKMKESPAGTATAATMQAAATEDAGTENGETPGESQANPLLEKERVPQNENGASSGNLNSGNPDAKVNTNGNGNGNGNGNDSLAKQDSRKSATKIVETMKQKLPDLGSPFRGIRQRIRRRRSRSAPPALRQSVLQEHFRVDPVKRVVLPGVPKHDADFARDAHDFFNLIVLIPIIALNIMNWNWDIVFNIGSANNHGGASSGNGGVSVTIQDAWTGAWFDLFLYTTILYFVVDLLWILVIPNCVKSPATIIQHHMVSLLYLTLPYSVEDIRFGLGVCMSVEINTWFLIARRVFNKQGFSPWVIDLSFVSFRVKLISICFYITWIFIRCIMFPLFLVVIVERWWKQSADTGTYFTIELMGLALHSTFCVLNLKWTYDLIMSKYRYLRRIRKGGAAHQAYKPDKGL